MFLTNNTKQLDAQFCEKSILLKIERKNYDGHFNLVGCHYHHRLFSHRKHSSQKPQREKNCQKKFHLFKESRKETKLINSVSLN